MPCNLIHGIPCANTLYRIRNATVQEIRHTRNVSYVTVSYVPPVPRGMTQTIILIVNNQTLIRNTYGRIFTRRHLELGMVIDADVSSAMTASIPPQARAIRITILPPAEPYSITLGNILQMNRNTMQILVGSFHEPSSQIMFNVSRDTLILNPRGQQIPFTSLRIGQLVRVDHSIAQTFSIPPQSAAFRIHVL